VYDWNWGCGYENGICASASGENCFALLVEDLVMMMVILYGHEKNLSC